MSWSAFVEWFMSLGREYGVNPYVFGSIYLGAIPFFSLSVAWIVRNIRRKRPVLLPILSAAFFFISAYLYLLVAGHGIPTWVYVLVAAMIAAGGASTIKKIRRQTGAEHATSTDHE